MGQTPRKASAKKHNKRHSNATQATQARLPHGSVAAYPENTNFSTNLSTAKMRTENARDRTTTRKRSYGRNKLHAQKTQETGGQLNEMSMFTSISNTSLIERDDSPDPEEDQPTPHRDMGHLGKPDMESTQNK